MSEPTRDRLSAEDPWGQRIGAWFEERFPPAMLVFGLPTFLAANLLGQATVNRSEISTHGPRVQMSVLQVVGWLAAVGFLLCVRVFDEHKDFDDDLRLHPDRLLSRGVVRLHELDVIAGVTLVGMVAFCFWADSGVGAVGIAFAVAFSWLLLMRVEFFVGSRLRPRLVLYALTHAVVTPLAGWWMFTTGARSLVAVSVLIPFLAASYLSSLLFEFTRKLLAPEDEQPGVATYSSVLGPDRAARVVSALVVIHAGAMVAVLLVVDSLGAARSVWWWGHLMGATALAAVLALGVFRRRPDGASHRPLEAIVGLNLLVPSLVVIVSVLAALDVEWTWR